MGIFSSKTKNELEKLIEENDELKNTLHTFVQKHQSLTEIDNKISVAQKSLSDLSQKADQLKNQIIKFDDELVSKRTLSDELTNTVKNLEERKNDFENTISLLEANTPITEELLDKFSNKQKELDKINQQYLSLQKNISFLKQEEARINNLLIQHDGNFDDVQYNFKKTEEEHNQRIAELKADESKKLSIIRSLDEKISLSEDIKNNLDASISALISQLSEKEKLFSEFISKRDLLLEEIQKNKSAYDEYEYKFNFHKETIGKLEEETKKLSEKKNSLTEEVRKFEIVKSELHDKILRLKTEEESSSEIISGKQKIIDELEKRKFDFEETHLKLENNLSQVLQKFIEEQTTSKARISLLKQEILDKEKEISSKEKTLLEKTYHIAEYGGLSKILQKERNTTEQIITNLKDQQTELNDEIPLLKEKIGKQRLTLQQLRAETEQLENKKESLDRELRSILTQANNNYVNLDETKQKILQEVIENRSELEELKDQVEKYTSELRNLKVEVAKTDAQKEEYTAKISELIAMENNLKYQISEHENKLDNIDGKKEFEN